METMYVVLEENLYYIEPTPKIVTDTLEKAYEWIAIQECSFAYRHQHYIVKEVRKY